MPRYTQIMLKSWHGDFAPTSVRAPRSSSLNRLTMSPQEISELTRPFERLSADRPLCTQISRQPQVDQWGRINQSLNWFDAARQLTERGAINMKRSLLNWI